MRIIWSTRAKEDVNAIRAYIARDSSYYASRFTSRMVLSVKVLAKFPEIGQVVPELAAHKVRELLYHNYRILYQICANHVAVIAVIHARRDLRSVEPKPWDVS
jgi:toxin ParE1/3/4